MSGRPRYFVVELGSHGWTVFEIPNKIGMTTALLGASGECQDPLNAPAAAAATIETWLREPDGRTDQRRYEAHANSITLVEDGLRYGQFRVDLVGATERLTRRIAEALNEYDRHHGPVATATPEGTE